MMAFIEVGCSVNQNKNLIFYVEDQDWVFLKNKPKIFERFIRQIILVREED